MRKLARILDVSIDELLLDEETHDLVKKTPVIEDRKEEKAQTAVYVAAALPYLMHVLGMVWEMKRKMTAAEDVGYAAAGAALSVVCLCVMLFGAYQSAVGKMDRRMICVMTAAYFLTGAGTRILSVISENTGSGGTLFYPYIVILAVMSAVTLLLLAGILRYYLTEKAVSPAAVYLPAALLIAGGAVLFVGRVWYLYIVGQLWTDIIFYDAMIRFFCNEAFGVLMIVQAREYNRKRQLADREREGKRHRTDQEREEKGKKRSEDQEKEENRKGGAGI